MMVLTIIILYFVFAIFFGVWLDKGKNSFDKGIFTEKEPSLFPLVLCLLWLPISVCYFLAVIFYKLMKKIGICE